MRILIAFVFGSMAASLAIASSSVGGIYDCADCKGLLEVKHFKAQTYSAKLVVGGGSCGGDVVAEGNAVLSKRNELRLPYKSGQKSCTTKIKFVPHGAEVSDTCITPEMEEGSTCATLGEYTQR